MIDWYPWVVLAHVLGAFAFILAHGVSAFVAFRLLNERRPDHVAGLLELSGMSLMAMYPALLVLLVAGITAGFMGGWWDELWIWSAIGLLVLVLVFMYAVGTRHYAAVRRAAGADAPKNASEAQAVPGPAEPEQLERLLRSSVPFQLAAVGGVGLALIVWLMEVKPF